MTGSNPRQPEAHKWSASQRWTLGVTSMASFMAGMDALVVTTALPTIHADLGAGTSALSWTVAAYALGFAAVVLAGTAFGDRYGRRRMFLAGVALFALASAGCAVSPDVGLLIATRTAQGIGGGLAVPLSLVLISEVFPPAQQAKAIGIWGAITGMAVAVAPVVGGAIVSGLAWRWIFWVNVPVGLAVLAAGMLRLARTPKVSTHLDLIGVVLGGSAVGALAYGVQEGPTAGWASAQVLAAAIAGVILACATVRWERRCPFPMVPSGLITNRSFTAAAAGRFYLGAALYGGGFLIPQFLQLEHHYSPVRVGLALLAWTGVVPFVAPIAGQVAQRRGERGPMVLGMAAMAASLLALVLFVRSNSSYLVFVGPLLLAGVGSSLAFPTTASATIRAVNFDQMGPAGGVGTVAFQLGAALGVSVVSAVFTSAGGYTSAPAFVDGMRPALLAIGVITALGIPAVNRFRPRVEQAAPADATADRGSEPALTARHLVEVGIR
jgi:EmrB/QacA subfamily drug resistance transporter